MRGTSMLLLLLALPLAMTRVEPADAEPAKPDPSRVQLVNEILAPATTSLAIEAFVGSPVVRCIPSSATALICEWQLDKQAAGWAPLAKAIDTVDRVAVICGVPKDGSARAAASCSAHPMRSNRKSWGKRRGPRAEGSLARARGLRLAQADKRPAARALLNTAGTALELSRLIGAAPSECAPGHPGTRVCIWRASARTYGHGTLAAAIDAHFSKKMELRCTLSIDGQPRAPDSCTVQIASW